MRHDSNLMSGNLINRLALGPCLFAGSVVLVRSFASYSKPLLTPTPVPAQCPSPTTPHLTPIKGPHQRNLQNVLPPIAKKSLEQIYFGKNPKKPEEYRGENPMNPPIVRDDYYNWFRDETRSREEVINHIKAENQYCEGKLAPLTDLKETLYQEMIKYLKESDDEVPYQDGPYLYYDRTVQGLSYQLHCRQETSAKEEEVILDENQLAEGHEYCDVGSVEPSPSHQHLAYSVDFTGNEKYDIRIKSLVSGSQEDIDVIQECGSSVEWGNDDSTIFYTKLDEELRPFQIWLHTIGTPQSEDLLLLEDLNKLFNVFHSKSMSKEYLFLCTESIETAEVHMIYLKHANGAEGHRQAAVSQQKVIQSKIPKLRYSIEHHESYFYLLTNLHDCHNSKLMRVPVSSSDYSASQWKEVTPYAETRELTHLLAFKTGLVVFGRENGSQKIWRLLASSTENNNGNVTHVHSSSAPLDSSVATLDGSMIFINSANDIPCPHPDWSEISFPEVCYSIRSRNNVMYDSSVVRVDYSSFVTPKSTIDINFQTNEQTILKRKEVPHYIPENYAVRRIFAPSNHTEGCLIPISLVFHRSLLATSASGALSESDLSFPVDRPMLLYGYGSYGACIDPSFDYTRLPLLDRGVVYAIAHIRGGGEMGRHQWYEHGGKYLSKMNTFYDFKDCALELIRRNITSSKHLAIVGRSAGGLLIGATINMYPELFKAAVADVPFVDVVNTMSDPTIPLTVGEWEEWGNPNEREFYDYMSQYCPYSNVKAQAYPSLLITAGLHDPRVAYWEPLKWISKLRELKTDNNLTLLETDLSSGHFSASDRYKDLKHKAFEMSFVINQITGEGDSSSTLKGPL